MVRSKKVDTKLAAHFIYINSILKMFHGTNVNLALQLHYERTPSRFFFGKFGEISWRRGHRTPVFSLMDMSIRGLKKCFRNPK